MEINVFNSVKKDYNRFCYKRFAKKEKAGAWCDGVVETDHKSTGHTWSMLCYRGPAQQGEKRTNSQKLPLASTQVQSINGHIFFSLSINQVRDIAKCVECLPSMYGCPAVEPSKQDSVVLCTYNPNTWETVAEKLPTVSSISAWTTYWAMVRTCSQTHISILSYRLNILRSF